MEYEKFCKAYALVGNNVAQFAVWFLWAALAAAVVAVIAEMMAKLYPANRAKTADDTSQSVVTLLEAIKGLVTALAAAPLWIALFAVGTVIFTVPGVAVQAACAKEAPPQ